MKAKNVLAVFLLLAVVCLSLGISAEAAIVIDLPDIVFNEPPAVAVIPGTYVYFAPDLEADILFYSGWWYRPYGERWYRARAYNGPWGYIRSNRVPRPLLNLPGDYRRGVIHERIHHDHFNRNWRNWERNRHWDKQDFWRNRPDGRPGHPGVRDGRPGPRGDHGKPAGPVVHDAGPKGRGDHDGRPGKGDAGPDGRPLGGLPLGVR